MNQETLKLYLTYSPDTGEFLRLVSTSSRARVGSVAGTITSWGYRSISVNGENHKAHRLAWLYMTGSWPVAEIDHINGVKDDNRWGNLREASHSENAKNLKLRTNNTSGVKGVYWHKRNKKWLAQCMVNGKQHTLGYFTDLATAEIVIRAFREKYHGEFANHG